MKCIKILLLFCAVIASGYAMHERCTGYSMRYINGFTFTSIKSNNGKRYSCNCLDTYCNTYTCRNHVTTRLQTITRPTIQEPVHEEETIIGEIPTESRGSSQETCQDLSSNENSTQSYPRGYWFVRNDGNRNLICKCPSTGPSILTCNELAESCPLPPKSSNVQSNQDYYSGSCYDPWNEQSYSNGQRYTRTRIMDSYRLITGTYSCSCSYGMMRCTAEDIPCCDSDSGRFVGMNEKVVRSMFGSWYKCTCKRGRGRVQDCISLRPKSFRQCSYNGRQYTVGSKWQRNYRRNNRVYEQLTCTCLEYQNSATPQAVCYRSG